jgi:hypothetical protein
MKVIIAGEELDINDDERILSRCKSLATRSIMLIPARQKMPALVELLAAVRYGYVKAGAVLAQAEVRGQDEVPRVLLAQLVDFLRDIIGEGKPQIQTPGANDNGETNGSNGDAETRGAGDGDSGIVAAD